MKSKYFRNPIVYCVYVLALLFTGVSLGESPLLVIQHLLAPYTLDVSRGVGKSLAIGFRGLTLFLQIALLFLVYLVGRPGVLPARTATLILGVIFAFMYFIIVTFGYFLPRLH